jgi:branched-chain amino acid aminotransferase
MSAEEAFCCGTAAVISPIGSITLGETCAKYGSEPGVLTQKLYDSLTNIQNEVEEDIFGWVHAVPNL